LAGPGVPKGRSEALVYLFDLYPTLCEMAGIAIPSELEGQSLVPVVQGKRKRVRDALFLAYRDVQRAARDERWKMIWYPKVGQIQLFDLSKDPDELVNLANVPAHSSELARLSTQLRDWQRAVGDAVPAPPAASSK